MNKLFLLLSIAALNVSAQSHTANPCDSSACNKPNLNISYAQKTAQILSGTSLEVESPDAALRNSFEVFSKNVQKSWGGYKSLIAEPMQTWSKSEIARKDQTILYPFSGPDFSTVYHMFPDAERYILIAMQKAEKPINYAEINAKGAVQSLEIMTDAWDKFGKNGFFVTEYLDKYYYKTNIRIGLSNFLVTFIHLYGFKINEIIPITINDTGEVVTLPLDSKDWTSIRIKFEKNGKSKYLDYLRMDLSNKGFAKRPEHLSFIKHAAINPVIFKAASHLPQNKDFSEFSDQILSKSPFILQDETGIKYSKLKTTYNIKLFGEFKEAHHSFRNYHRDLAQAFKDSADVKPLNFKIGYYKNGNYSLIVANRMP